MKTMTTTMIWESTIYGETIITEREEKREMRKVKKNLRPPLVVEIVVDLLKDVDEILRPVIVDRGVVPTIEENVVDVPDLVRQILVDGVLDRMIVGDGEEKVVENLRKVVVEVEVGVEGEEDLTKKEDDIQRRVLIRVDHLVDLDPDQDLEIEEGEGVVTVDAIEVGEEVGEVVEDQIPEIVRDHLDLLQDLDHDPVIGTGLIIFCLIYVG